MPAEDDGYIRPDETKRTRTIFYMGYDNGDVPLSPTDSDTTDYLEDSVTPPVITPHSSSQSSMTTESLISLAPLSSEDDLLIPLYLFHVVERTSLNIEFNRCLQLSLLHVNENYGKPSRDEDTGEGTSAGFNAGPSGSAGSVEESNVPTRNVPVIQLDSEEFDVLLYKINNYIEEFDDPELLMELVLRHLYNVEIKQDDSEYIIPQWLFEESEMIIPPYLFEEPEEIELIIPPYMFKEPEELVMLETTSSIQDDENSQQEQVQPENIFNMLAGGDFNDLDDLISLFDKSNLD